MANRLQHVSQVKTLLESIDPKGKNIQCLVDDHGHAVWKQWVEVNLENQFKEPGTIIRYLTSLEKVINFVTSNKTKEMPPLYPEHCTLFESLKPALKGWRAIVDATTQDRQVRQYIDQCDNLPTREELDSIKESTHYKQAEKLIVESDHSKSLAPSEFPKIRDMLLVKITVKAGTRPILLENAIIQDFTTAKSDKNAKVILVPNHKRSKEKCLRWMRSCKSKW